MRVLVIGATGYIGSQVATQLQSAGHTVVALARNNAQAHRLAQQGYATAPGDLADLEALQAATHSVDGVINTAFGHSDDFFEAVKVEQQAVAALLAALLGTEKPLIISTASGILGDTGSFPVDESFQPDKSFPAAARAAVEATVQRAEAEGVRAAVVRVPILAYGRGASQFPPLLLETARRTGISAYIGEGTNKIANGYVDDVAAAYVLALTKASPGAVYNISNPPVAFRDVAVAVRDNVGGTCQLESISADQAVTHWNPFVAMLLSMNNQVSAERALTELGWKPSGPSVLNDIRSGSYKAEKV